MFIFALATVIDPTLTKLGQEAMYRVLIASEPLLLLLIGAVVTAMRHAQKKQYKKQDEQTETEDERADRLIHGALIRFGMVPRQTRDVPAVDPERPHNAALHPEKRRRNPARNELPDTGDENPLDDELAKQTRGN